MTTHTQASVDITVGTRVASIDINYILLKEYQSLSGLESRSWRIESGNGSVGQRPVGCIHQHPVVFSSITPDEE